MSASQIRIEPTIGASTNRMNWNVPRPASEPLPDRPIFLSFVAILFLFGGIACAILLLGNWPVFLSIALDAGLDSDWPHTVTVMVLISALAGIFLFIGGPAGWYLAIFLLIEGLLAAAIAWTTATAEGVPLTFWAENTISWYTKFGLRAFLSMALVLYFLSRPVREYCSMTWGKCSLAVAIVCALELAIYSLQV